MSSTVFGLFEFTFRGVSGSKKLGLPLTWSNFMSNAYTTWEQWFANVLFGAPIYKYYYTQYFDEWTIILTFPLYVFFAEIITGYFLIYVWGRRAWLYQDSYSFFHGNITLSYTHYWWILGYLHVLFSSVIYNPLSEALTSLIF
eukprot:TRINITY_DN1120_c0_g1_i2.p1 TRINITY_DN1120_c0_g1~~TRINITY_DN1120_c0_g1_i2.p1  ORF type:complete len:143 (-),score=10.82 TRINITY_DN1120_c0_g1_i2:144-572(-)